MAKVEDVLVKYHKIIPFPWTIRKIKKANLKPTAFLLEVGTELAKCEDADSPEAIELLSAMRKLDMGI